MNSNLVGGLQLGKSWLRDLLQLMRVSYIEALVS